MSYVAVQPEVLAAAVTELHDMGLSLKTAGSSVAGPTTGMLPPAADSVSTLAAAQLTAHAHLYQLISAQAYAVHERFTAVLGHSATAYAETEAANVVAAG